MFKFKTIPRCWRWLVVGLCAFLLSLGIGLAQAASPFYWDFVNVDITLESNGDMVVAETQKYTFTADHTNQRYRYIPLRNVDQITDVTVYEGEEQIPIQTGIEDNQYWIRWRHAVKAPESHIFKVQYRVTGGVQIRGANSQIYWRALFSERNADIKQGKVTIHLPNELAGEVSQVMSEGVTAVSQQVGPNTLEFVVDQPLAPQQFLDVKVRFPTGLLTIENADDVSDTTIAPRNAFPFQNPLFMTLLWLGFIGLVVWGGLYIRSHHQPCPMCGKRSLYRVNRVSQRATTQRKGEKVVGHACSHCHYRQTRIESIAKLPDSASTSGSPGSYYGGGGFGGGGGGFGGGGGGG
ncbi:DUF2207 domain-containing protein [Nodosilinea sp. LEGE 06152]|uniref:DUF2207 domain-containing protein n=1 Tax=Nodosilinea sp. LEGE 06152 TaxID=2777966 RepID=UPI001882368D|nr:DUF2207 domain-containing protein [Nodosilinea sp. LEGE 06152]MBE9160347.1 DUF2207 domain-containing protein [Nodosilinea sp. LEGE 06152]